MLPQTFRDVISAVVTLALLVLLFFTVFAVLDQLGSDPVRGEDGTIIKDSFARAKDFFVIVFPLFTAVTSFWLGAAVEGKRADDKEKEADKAQAQMKAVLDVSEPGVLERARSQYSEAFQ